MKKQEFNDETLKRGSTRKKNKEGQAQNNKERHIELSKTKENNLPSEIETELTPSD